MIRMNGARRVVMSGLDYGVVGVQLRFYRVLKAVNYNMTILNLDFTLTKVSQRGAEIK